MYLNEKFWRLVHISLQRLQSEANLDSYEEHNNLIVTNCLDPIPNPVLPIFVIREKPQASKEEITTCEISHPPSDSLPNEFLVINSLDDEEFL